jgi:S-sulfo-L-cysteine synthase (O-acetyl-L-serine-dependent)
MMHIYKHIKSSVSRKSITSLVGNTPLIQLNNSIPSNGGISVYAKLEWYNPGGSVKDRPAVYMLRDGESSGKLTHAKTVIDATSGNTGIAYAVFCKALGYTVQLVIPANAGIERRKILKTLGAKLILSDPLEGTDGAQQKVQEIVRNNPGRYFYPDQYNNDSNWRAHYETTAVEILDQTGGRITHFIAGLGTTGTFTGVSRRLKEYNKNIQCIAVEPDSPLHGIEGLKHMPTALVPGIYDKSLVDELIRVSTEETYDCVKRLARDEGILAGLSSGAAFAAAFKLIRQFSDKKPGNEPSVVMIFPDSADKYLSDTFWDE